MLWMDDKQNELRLQNLKGNHGKGRHLNLLNPLQSHPSTPLEVLPVHPKGRTASVSLLINRPCGSVSCVRTKQPMVISEEDFGRNDSGFERKVGANGPWRG